MTRSIKNAYISSWVYVYYNCEVDESSDDYGSIMFAVPGVEPNIAFEHRRIAVYVKLPANGKLFFCNPRTLADLGALASTFFLADTLSLIHNAMPSRGYGHTTSPYYTPPYLLVFRTGQQGIESNFHAFNDFNVAPSMTRVLALLNYDDNLDKFIAVEYMDLRIPYQNVYSLRNMLEFYIVDSQKKLVEFQDLSQLFVNITAIH
jgi:hypothetical protein